MCCLFGLIDYRHGLTGRKKNQIISVLASACEARGTDATGIAYNVGGTQRIYKRPVPAHCMHIRIPEPARVMMGHTRMTTQGSAKHNYNNHPFPGSAGKDVFALAHNGVLYNDQVLRRELHLPRTKIQADSYIAVQLIEQKNALNFDSLRYMAEKVEGLVHIYGAGSEGPALHCQRGQPALPVSLSVSGNISLCLHGGDFTTSLA